MKWPLLVIDDFDPNIDRLVEFAHKQEYHPGQNFPGCRSDFVHNLNPKLFESMCIKTLAALFPDDYKLKAFKASSFLQKIPPNLIDGWVHQDHSYQFTSILYLNKNMDAGTSMYKPLSSFPEVNAVDKQEYFTKVNKGEKITKKEESYLLSKREENNSQFKKTIYVNSEFNRLVLFDGYQYHAAENYNSDNKEDRLIYITFWHEVFDTEKTLNPNATTAKRII